MSLTRFWFEFDIETATGYPAGIGHGCGVTAFDMIDAINIMDERVFLEFSRPAFRKAIENIDVSTLDPDHVIPNMKHPLARGIWFPLGYD